MSRPKSFTVAGEPLNMKPGQKEFRVRAFTVAALDTNPIMVGSRRCEKVEGKPSNPSEYEVTK